MHLSASKSVHFNTQEPTYAFSECDGGGDECSDDEYVFSCAFSDSLMKKCLKKKKEEEEKEVVVKECEACAKKEEQIEAQQARLCVMDAELVKTRRVAREKVTMRTDGDA